METEMNNSSIELTLMLMREEWYKQQQLNAANLALALAMQNTKGE